MNKNCEHFKYPARWGTYGWICENCGEEIECSVKYTQEDMKPYNKNGFDYAPNPCCPSCPHKN